MTLDLQTNPLSQFMYSLKASETRRQWPQRLKMLFDFLKIEGDLGHQSTWFAGKAKKDPKWFNAIYFIPKWKSEVWRDFTLLKLDSVIDTRDTRVIF